MKENKKGSLFTLLLRNYIVFTIVVVIVFIVSILLSYFGNQLNIVDLSQIVEYKSLLECQQYDKFPRIRLFGENSTMIVLDEDNHTIYNSGNLKVDLSKEDLFFIPNAIPEFYVDSKELDTFDKKKNYEITISSNNGSEDIFILDDNFSVIYGTKNFLGDNCTKKQYLLMTNQYYKDLLVHKYQFETNMGNENTMLLFRSGNQNLVELQKIGTMFTQFILYFTLFYILLIIVLILWLKKKINEPLQLLCDTFENYHVGQSIEQKYKGPKEFMNIFTNFSFMAKRLNESEQQKKTLEENKSRMIANIVHDFKTPIAIIKGYTQAIDDGVIPLENQQQVLSIINKKTTQLNDLILNLYEYSKMDHPDFCMHKETLDICVYFRDLVAQWYNELELAGFQLEVNIPDSHVLIDFDPMQLKRVFSNIISNAMNHTEKGTTLYFGLEEQDDSIILLLGDNGKGIAPELAEDIFEPFVMQSTSRNEQGSGLGLSIAKKIIEMHNGTLKLIFHTQWNTLFQIKLPKS